MKVYEYGMMLGLSFGTFCVIVGDELYYWQFLGWVVAVISVVFLVRKP